MTFLIYWEQVDKKKENNAKKYFCTLMLYLDWTNQAERQIKNYFWFPVNTTSASEEPKPLEHTCG